MIDFYTVQYHLLYNGHLCTCPVAVRDLLTRLDGRQTVEPYLSLDHRVYSRTCQMVWCAALAQRECISPHISAQRTAAVVECARWKETWNADLKSCFRSYGLEPLQLRIPGSSQASHFPPFVGVVAWFGLLCLILMNHNLFQSHVHDNGKVEVVMVTTAVTNQGIGPRWTDTKPPCHRGNKRRTRPFGFPTGLGPDGPQEVRVVAL